MTATFIALAIDNYQTLGRLIKTWALGEDRVKDGNPYPRPGTIDEFCNQLMLSGAASDGNIKAWRDSFGGRLTKLQVLQTTPDTLVLRLPMAEMIKSREASISDGESYALPSFYSPYFFADAPQVAPTPAGKALEAHDRRVGDYSITQCG